MYAHAVAQGCSNIRLVVYCKCLVARVTGEIERENVHELKIGNCQLEQRMPSQFISMRFGSDVHDDDDDDGGGDVDGNGGVKRDGERFRVGRQHDRHNIDLAAVNFRNAITT